MEYLSKSVLDNLISLTISSEKKFKVGDFKGAIDDKREVKAILESKFTDKKILEIYRYELSKIYDSKFDLIFDHKLRINELKKNNIIKFLDQKSEEKYQLGDFKGAIKAARRSDKYLLKNI